MKVLALHILINLSTVTISEASTLSSLDSRFVRGACEEMVMVSTFQAMEEPTKLFYGTTSSDENHNYHYVDQPVGRKCFGLYGKVSPRRGTRYRATGGLET